MVYNIFLSTFGTASNPTWDCILWDRPSIMDHGLAGSTFGDFRGFITVTDERNVRQFPLAEVFILLFFICVWD